MADLDKKAKRNLESSVDMGGGYLRNFSSVRFADVIEIAVGFDPYE